MKKYKKLMLSTMTIVVLCIFCFKVKIYGSELEFGDSYVDSNIYTRTSEYTINDDGRFLQSFDRIVSSDYTYSIMDMKNHFSYVTISLSIQIKEVDDGYQHFFLYNGISENSTLLASKKFEHYPGAKNTSYASYIIRFDCIPLSLFNNDEITIRYGASGEGDDDWKNKNLSVTLDYSIYNPDISLNIKYTENLSANETKNFCYYIDDEMYYVVETRGDLDTYLTIEGLSSGTLTDDDNGVGRNASIGFKGEVGWIIIKLRCFSPTASGTTEIQIRRQQAVMYGFDYGGSDINTKPDLDEPYNDLRSSYYVDRYTDNTDNGPRHIRGVGDNGYARINSEIVFFTGHGNTGSVSFPSGTLYSSSLSSMENTKVVVWASCYSSAFTSTTTSMTQASINAGALSAVGWPDATYVSSSRKFTNRFFDKLMSGATVKEACDYADNAILLPSDSILNWDIDGKSNTTITPNITNKVSKLSAAPSSLSVEIVDLNTRTNSSNNWVTYKLKNETRVYYTVNGYLTNDFYCIKEENGKIVNVEHSGFNVESLKVMPTLRKGATVSNKISVDNVQLDLYEIETHIIYCELNGVLVPIELKYCKYYKNDIFHGDIICTNLNTGDVVDYDDIS